MRRKNKEKQAGPNFMALLTVSKESPLAEAENSMLLSSIFHGRPDISQRQWRQLPPCYSRNLWYLPLPFHKRSIQPWWPHTLVFWTFQQNVPTVLTEQSRWTSCKTNPNPITKFLLFRLFGPTVRSPRRVSLCETFSMMTHLNKVLFNRAWGLLFAT